MVYNFSFLCTLCQTIRSSVNRDSDSGSGAKLATSDENEELSDSVKLSIDASTTSQQLCVARDPSTTRPASRRRGLSSRKPYDQFGLKLFNAENRGCQDSGECQVDVVAVHGLGGHRESTWTYSEGTKQSSETDPLWLRDFLPQELPGSRIFTYGYDSKVLESRSVSTINDFARKLLKNLQNYREHHEAINLAYNEHEYQKISANIRGVVFLGTPHRGSNLAWWGTLLSKVIFPVELRRDLMSALEPDSSPFQTIADGFRQRADNLKIFSYYETMKTERRWGSALIVGKNSATLGFPGESMHPMERDHTSMCRFVDADDGEYRSIVDDLKKCVPQKFEEVTSSAIVDECLAWMGRKAASVSSESTPQPVFGTCIWFFQHARLSKWLSRGTEGGLLWVTGDFGSGKTLLSAFVAKNLVEYVRTQLSPPILDPVIVCYYSCDQGFNGETSVMKILSTLLYQILVKQKDLSSHAICEWVKPGQPLLENFDTLWKVFIATLEDDRLGYTVVVIDAIDECKEATQRLYVESFRLLLNTPCLARKVRILFTSQRSIILKSSFRDVLNIHLDDAPFSGFVSDDMDRVIKYELDEGQPYPQKQRDFLERSLCEQAGRTYLWVKFVIQELRTLQKRTPNTIRAVFDRVPKDLTKHYEQCLVNSGHEDSRQDAVKLLKIISASFQPLDTEEISFAVAVSGNQFSVEGVDEDREFNIELYIRNTLGFLVRIAVCRVYLVHNSLKRYLEGLSSLPKDDQLATFALTTEAAHLKMAKIYFDKDEFQRTPYCVEDLCQIPDFDPEYSGVDFLFESERVDASAKGLKFFDYCAVNWTTHVALAAQSAAEDTDIVAAIIRICAKDSSILRNWLGFYWSTLGPKKEVDHDFDPMVVASHFGLDAVILCLIDKGFVDVGKSEPRALYWAATEGKTSIVKMLLSRNVPASFKSISDWTPLIGAAAAGHTETVEALLSMNEIGVNETTACGRSALSYAIGNGHIEVSKLLLKFPNVDVNNADIEDDTPLIHAMSDGNMDVLCLLLEDGRADLAHANRHDRTALSYAAEYGHVAIVKVLLDQSPDSIELRLENDRKRPPLLYAAAKGHLEILILLRSSRVVDFSARDTEGFNTVILASKYHHVNILQYLSVQDPKAFKAVDLGLASPLGFAFIGNSPRRLKAINYLLQTGLVDLEQRENMGRTTLFRAAASGFIEGVQRLIDKGAKLNAVDELGWTPLHYVVSVGQSPEMVSCLLSNGADAELCDNEELTPLELAQQLSKSQEAQELPIIKVLDEKRKEVAEERKRQKSRSAGKNM